MIKGPKNLIYGLIDPRTLLIRYVGLSSTGMSRPKMHRNPSCPDTYCRNWIKKLEREGLTYEITILEVLEDVDRLSKEERLWRLSKAEQWWIAYGRMSNWPLTNLTDGGALTKAGAAEKKRRKINQTFAHDFERYRNLERVAKFQTLCDFPLRTQGEITSDCFRVFEKCVATHHVILDAVVMARVSYATARLLYKEWLALFHVGDLKLDKLKIFQVRASGIKECVAANKIITQSAVTQRTRVVNGTRFNGTKARWRDKLIAHRKRLLLETAYQRGGS